MDSTKKVEEIPAPVAVNQNEADNVRPIDNDKCQKCGKGTFEFNYRRFHHSALHTNVLRFECGADGCDVKSNCHENIKKHFMKTHVERKLLIKDLELTKEQTDELNEIAKECFPNANFEEYAIICQLCQHKAKGRKERYKHVIHHLDFMLYKCVESGCTFEAKNSHFMRNHEKTSHKNKKGDSELTMIHFTKELELKIEEMMKKCFPVREGPVEYNGRRRFKFECGVDGCDFNAYYRKDITNHFKETHPMDDISFRTVELTREQIDELNEMKKMCLIKVDEDSYAMQCQLCSKKRDSNGRKGRYNHAITHVDFKLYKCVEPDCPYEAKYPKFMKMHERTSHGKERDPELTKIQLSEEQELEIEEMIKKCFPVINKD